MVFWFLISVYIFLYPGIFFSFPSQKSVRGCCESDLSAGLRTCKKKKIIIPLMTEPNSCCVFFFK